MTASQRLATAIIRQAIVDLQAPSPHVRRRALRFLDNSASLRSWCQQLDLDPASAIAAIARDIRFTLDDN
jgi:hypothetical protein